MKFLLGACIAVGLAIWGISDALVGRILDVVATLGVVCVVVWAVWPSS